MASFYREKGKVHILSDPITGRHHYYIIIWRNGKIYRNFVTTSFLREKNKKTAFSRYILEKTVGSLFSF